MATDPAQEPIEQVVNVLAELRAQNVREVPRAQLGIEWLTRKIGRPWFAYAVAFFVAGWIIGDVLAARIEGRAFDGLQQFPWLQIVLAIFSLMMTIFILITENRQGAIAERRAQATLQIALVSEQKIAKLIELIEQLRRDDPLVPNREDTVADRMAEATDLRTALDRLDEAEVKALDESGRA